SRIETRKIIEVLSFRGDKPRLGADLFEGGRLPETRKIYAYSFQATMHLEFRPEEDRIVMDHLNALRPELSGQAAFTGPDLSYDAYQWNKGRWIFERDVDVKDLDPDRRPYNAPPKPPGP
ncbi:MAG: hypothetical protein KDB88_13830, partial [Flavobacteriales bacterium]|nr:hypothetical protein [Flavobacteriales bacterium]